MSKISNHTIELVRRNLPRLQSEVAPDAVVSIEGMVPHQMSFSEDLASEELDYLFPLNVDGQNVHIYMHR